jgi:hypothetical protein
MQWLWPPERESFHVGNLRRHPHMPDEYRSDQCRRDGGALDLRPGSSAWPS